MAGAERTADAGGAAGLGGGVSAAVAGEAIGAAWRGVGGALVVRGVVAVASAEGRGNASSRTVEVGASGEVLSAERADATALFVAASLVVLARVRRGGAGLLGGGALVDSALDESVAAARAEGARRRTGAGTGGVVLDAPSSVGAVAGLRRRGVFGRSASSMRRSLAASEHRAPCARLC
jgi:hypothetical protein